MTNGTSSETTYAYDAAGRITGIYAGGSLRQSYAYDALGQLVREDDADAGFSYTYEYDAGGNLTLWHKHDYTTGPLGPLVGAASHSHRDPDWPDLFTSMLTSETKDPTSPFKVWQMSYDAIGNPLAWRDDMTLTWELGRRLAAASAPGLSVAYAYDDAGMRTSKTVNGITTAYTVSGATVLRQTDGTDTLDFYLDASGKAIGFRHNGSADYWYVRNGQGDVVGIINAVGSEVVSYSYNAWGMPLTVTGSLASTIGELSPYRYRGYPYDAETGLYCLQTRYYDPELCRFLNADGLLSTGQGVLGHNMFAYCNNDPVNGCDPSGMGMKIGLLSSVFTPALEQLLSAPLTIVGQGYEYVDNDFYFGIPYGGPGNCYSVTTDPTGQEAPRNPGDLSGYGPVDRSSTSGLYKAVEADMLSSGNTIRPLNGPYDLVYFNEYRVAMAVGPATKVNPLTGDYYADFHFMVQTATGQWSDKAGVDGIKRLYDSGLTPDDITWTIDGEYFYDADGPIYFAIGK